MVRNPSGPQESENLTGWTSPSTPPEEDPREKGVDTAETSDQVTVPWNRFRLLPERTGAAVVGGCRRWRGGVREVHEAASCHRRSVTRGIRGEAAGDHTAVSVRCAKDPYCAKIAACMIFLSRYVVH